MSCLFSFWSNSTWLQVKSNRIILSSHISTHSESSACAPQQTHRHPGHTTTNRTDLRRLSPWSPPPPPPCPPPPWLTSSSGRSGSRCVKLCSTTGLRSSTTSSRTPSQMLRTRHDESNISSSGPGLTRRASVRIPGIKTMDARLEPTAQSRQRGRHVGVLISDQYRANVSVTVADHRCWPPLGESWLRLGFSKPRPERLELHSRPSEMVQLVNVNALYPAQTSWDSSVTYTQLFKGD